jgi:hypothetical protein
MRNKLFAVLSGVAIAASVLALSPDDAVAKQRGATRAGVAVAGVRGGSGVRNAFAADIAVPASAMPIPVWVGSLNCWTPGLGAAWLNTCYLPYGGYLY